MRLLLVLAIIALSTWIAKIQLKRSMQRQMGRKVSDAELTSITSWMQAHDQADKRERQ